MTELFRHLKVIGIIIGFTLATLIVYAFPVVWLVLPAVLVYGLIYSVVRAREEEDR